MELFLVQNQTVKNLLLHIIPTNKFKYPIKKLNFFHTDNTETKFKINVSNNSKTQISISLVVSNIFYFTRNTRTLILLANKLIDLIFNLLLPEVIKKNYYTLP